MKQDIFTKYSPNATPSRLPIHRMPVFVREQVHARCKLYCLTKTPVFGSKLRATMPLSASHSNGESSGGRYFWVHVRDRSRSQDTRPPQLWNTPGMETISRVLDSLVRQIQISGNFDFVEGFVDCCVSSEFRTISSNIGIYAHWCTRQRGLYNKR